ncbi:MAG: hypothetical protein SGJ05_05860 [bacterium]|nr:hypothetical protein [bacterium]
MSATRYDRSAYVADFHRIGWPLSVGIGGRLQLESVADIIGMRRWSVFDDPDDMLTHILSRAGRRRHEVRD